MRKQRIYGALSGSEAKSVSDDVQRAIAHAAGITPEDLRPWHPLGLSIHGVEGGVLEPGDEGWEWIWNMSRRDAPTEKRTATELRKDREDLFFP